MKDRNIGIVKARKEFDMRKGVNIPKRISHHIFGKTHLFIAPDKATWIATNDTGALFLKLFKDGHTLEQTMEIVKNKTGMEFNCIVKELNDLLIKIERKGFYEDAVVKQDIEEITLQLFLTNRCNLRCIHCYLNSGLAYKNELTTQEWIKVIDDFSDFYKTRVTFSGGEPLVFKGFLILAKRAKEKGVVVELFTNGTLINKTTFEKMIAKIDIIQLSLDGATEEVNDRIRGKGVFQKVMEAIHLLKDTNIKIRLSMLVLPQNIDDLKNNIEKFVNSLGSEKIEIKFGFASVLGRANKSFQFESDYIGEREMIELLSIIYTKNLKPPRKIQPNLKIENCGFGDNISISSTGDVYPCAVLQHYKVGNVRKDKLKELMERLRKERELTKIQNLQGCSECDLMYICFGGCRLNNILKNKNLLIPYCTPSHKENRYLSLIARDEFDALSIWMQKI